MNSADLEKIYSFSNIVSAENVGAAVPAPIFWEKIAAPVDFIEFNGVVFPVFKSENTLNNSPVYVSDSMSGKLTGFPCISTSCQVNPICRARMENGDSVCSKCFADAVLDRYSATSVHTVLNSYLLTFGVLPLEFLPIFGNVRFVRFESFGDIANKNQIINYFNICRVNPGVNFTLWTKNFNIVHSVIAAGYDKPENLTLVHSSSVLNRPENIPAFFDKVFTVYTSDYIDDNGGDDIFINCGARSCINCQLCYNPSFINVSDIREKLKKGRNK